MKEKRGKKERPLPSQTPREFAGSEEFAIGDSVNARPIPNRVHLAINDNHDLLDKDSTDLRYLSSVVTECLDLHEACMGSYIDRSGKYILRCCCSCRRGEDVTTSVAD